MPTVRLLFCRAKLSVTPVQMFPLHRPKLTFVQNNRIAALEVIHRKLRETITKAKLCLDNHRFLQTFAGVVQYANCTAVFCSGNVRGGRTLLLNFGRDIPPFRMPNMKQLNRRFVCEFLYLTNQSLNIGFPSL